MCIRDRANLSASNITVGKAETRRLLSQSQSARCLAAYVYAAAGVGESTTDLAWDGPSSAPSTKAGQRFRAGVAVVEVMAACPGPRGKVPPIGVGM